MADRIGVMNLGRLLEMGGPNELYTRPATRFVATFLGAANLILGRQTKDGIRFGERPVSAISAVPPHGMREHEVVAVVRPEEIEVAPTREALTSGYLARGAVDEIVFTGALERMRIRLDGGADALPLAYSNGDGSPYLEVTRTQHEQRAFEVTKGQSVAIGVRRVHVLPTPLSSFTVCAANEALLIALTQQPMLVELASRMKTRISTRLEPMLGVPGAQCGDATAFSGTTVIASQPDVAHQAEWLLRRGADEVLVLPVNALPPQRVLIHWADEAVRSATLAVSASVLRHVSAEAVYIGILPQLTPTAQRPHGMRALLDARSEAQAVHGLEMRTELRFGDVAPELRRQLGESPGQMLILGVCDVGRLVEPFGSLLESARWPVLIVRRENRANEDTAP
jgi:sulfate transport system ATP-binding protein